MGSGVFDTVWPLAKAVVSFRSVGIKKSKNAKTLGFLALNGIADSKNAKTLGFLAKK